MDLCAFFLGLFMVLVILAFVGHGLWIVGEAIVKAVFRAQELRRRHRPWHECTSCGTQFSTDAQSCPECGLSPHDPISLEMSQLDAVEERIAALAEAKKLPADIADTVQRAIRAQRRTLADELSASDIGKTQSFRQVLENLLEQCPDIQTLTADERRQALACYRKLSRPELARLSPASLLRLARLLRMAGFTSRVLDVYEQLLESYPESPQARPAAVEAGRLALHDGKTDLAHRFLLQARTYSLSPEERKEIDELLTSLLDEDKTILPVIVEEEAVGSPSTESATIVAPAPPAAGPPRPRATWGQLLAGFMEERNILWGELVGGLLIVGCSIALVISLWQTLENIPYFPFLIFAAISMALFGAGLYTLRHWKLEATSRGLLTIGVLLTPLNFLVLAGLSRGQEQGAIDRAAELLAVAVFAWMVLVSARILTAPLPGAVVRGDLLLTVAVVGASASQLLVPRWIDIAQPFVVLFAVLSLIPVLLHTFAASAVAWGLGRQEGIALRQANSLFSFLGQTTFSAAVALGFIVYWSEQPVQAFHHLAVPVAVLGLPLLLCGALVSARLSSSDADHTAALSPSLLRWIGTVIALAGMLVMAGALVLGWPRPLALLVVGLVNAAVFFIVALAFRLPHGHGPGIASLAVVFLTLFHVLTGDLPLLGIVASGQMRFVLRSPASGLAMMLLALALAGSSEMFARAGRRLDALTHVIGAGIAAFLAMGLVLPDDPRSGRGTLVFGICALAGFLVNMRWQKGWLTGVCSWVLLGAIGCTFFWQFPRYAFFEVWAAAFLTHASVTMAAGIFLLGRSTFQNESRQVKPVRDAFAVPLQISALTSSLLATFALYQMTSWHLLVDCVFHCAWLAGVWFTFSLVWQSSGWFTAAQGAITAGVLYGCTAWLYEERIAPLLPALVEVPSLQVYSLGLAGLGLFWLLARLALAQKRPVYELLSAGWRWLDGPLQAIVVIGNLLLVVVVTLPEIQRETDGLVFQMFEGVVQLVIPLPDFSLLLAMAVQVTLSLTFIGYFWEGRFRIATIGLALLAITLPMIWAMQFAPVLAVGTAARWGWAMLDLACCLLLWFRGPLARLAEKTGIHGFETDSLSRSARWILLTGMAFPVLILTGRMSAYILMGIPLAGPIDGFFSHLEPIVSIQVPLLLLILGLAGNGVRENSSGYIFSAGVLLATTIVNGRLLDCVFAQLAMDMAQTAFLVQLASGTLCFWSLAWLATGRWRQPTLQATLLCLALLFNVGLFQPAVIHLLARDVPFSGWVVQASSLAGWLGWITLMIAAVWLLRIHRREQVIHALGLGSLGLAILAALTAARWDVDGWLFYHVLSLALIATPLGLLVCSVAGARWGWLRDWFPALKTRRWIECLSCLSFLLAVYGIWDDPWRPYLSAAIVLTLSVLFGCMAVWAARPGYIYLSGLLLNGVAYLLWQGKVEFPGWFELTTAFDEFLVSQVLGFAIGSAVWSLIEMRLRRPGPVGQVCNLPGRLQTGPPILVPYGHVAAVAATVIMTLLAVAGIVAELVPLNYRVPFPATWWALAATLLALLLTLWDPHSRFCGFPAAPLYALGPVAIAVFLHWLSLPPALFGWAAGLMLAIFFFEAAAAYHLAPRLSGLSRLVRLPPRAEPLRLGWFLPAQALLGLVALILSIWICLDFEHLWDRLPAPFAAGLLGWATIWLVDDWPRLNHLARPWGLKDSRPLAYLALTLGVVILVEAGWAFLDPAMEAPWLHRTVVFFAVLCLRGGLYGSKLARRQWPEPPWPECLQTMSKVTLFAAGLILIFLLGQEFALYDPELRQTPMLVSAVLAVAVILLGAIAVAIRLALSSETKLDERGRMRLVWMAELLVVVIFLHVRLNRPDWIPSLLNRYWPLFVMALGFASVGLAELFRRRGWHVLAEPLQRTGIFLPLLPLLAYLVRPLGDMEELGQAVPGIQPLLRYLQALPEGYAMHALLWFLLGMLYLQVAIMRRTSTFAFLACLAANFGLWVIYADHQELSFLLHPQIWLIPVGFIVLAAEHWHRDSLDKNHSAALRYFGLLLILVSSSADMFITGLGNSVLLPLVLAVLSIAGVLAGILLRVRAFLFLGVTFLFLVVFAQIWHAAVDRAQTWVWWASGIVLGAAILALFAIFEKRRHDVLRIVEDIKRWE